MTLAALQAAIARTYGERDRRRGMEGSFLWFVEEVGELARALRRDDPDNLRAEFADVLAWLVTLAGMAGVDLDQAARRYARGCPRCDASPCACTHRST
jgi:NTP pyrophosphatase (non-canonical NTP hydrolase)